MVVAISIFDTLAFLSSSSPDGIAQNIRTDARTHADHYATEECTNEHAHVYSARRLCTVQHRGRIFFRQHFLAIPVEKIAFSPIEK